MSSSLFALLSLALSPETQPAQTLTIPPSIAQMVMVDAFVTDRKGRPITDLRAEDFELLEDSRRVAIVAFQPPKDGGAVAPIGSSAATPPEKASLAPEREPITLVIYVDRWLLSGSGRKRALDQAASLAESHIAQSARVVVIADDKGLRPLTPLTTDPNLVRAALTRIQGWATSAPSVADSRNTLENIKSIIEGSVNCDCVCLLPQLVSVIRTYAFSRVIEVQEASDRLTFLVNALLGVSGRKALIYVSEGLEQRPGIHLYDQLTKICPQALHRDASSIFAPMQEFETSPPLREVVARANAARVTFYPLDARGLQAYSSADITQADQTYVPSARTDMILDANLNNPLQLLGEETGGFAMLRGLDPKAAMKRFDADERGHYIVGFVPGDADGKIHSLRVRLNDKAQAKRNPEIRHRQAYLRAELPVLRGQRSLATLLFDLEENALDAQASVERTGETTARVHVSVPLSALKPTPGTDGKEARVQVVLSFRKAQSEKSPVTVREKDVTFALTPEELTKDGGRREIIVDVPIGPGGYEFAIGVEDIASGSAAHVRRSLGPAQGP